MLSPSTKSDSVSARPAPKWRVKRTLKRHTEFRPIEADDIRYFWAAYKQGADLGMAEGMSPEEFKELVGQWIAQKVQMAWTVLASVNGKTMPVGSVFCAWSPFGNFLIVLYVIWMPWASKRIILESTINFVATARKEYNFQGYAAPEHKRLYEVCAMHGLCRRVGTTYTAMPGTSLAVFETRGGPS
jgi:hypothetical protein